MKIQPHCGFCFKPLLAVPPHCPRCGAAVFISEHIGDDTATDAAQVAVNAEMITVSPNEPEQLAVDIQRLDDGHYLVTAWDWTEWMTILDVARAAGLKPSAATEYCRLPADRSRKYAKKHFPGAIQKNKKWFVPRRGIWFFLRGIYEQDRQN